MISIKDLSQTEVNAVEALWHILHYYSVGSINCREYNGIILCSNEHTSRVVMNKKGNSKYEVLEVSNNNLCLFATPRIPYVKPAEQGEVVVICGDAEEEVPKLPLKKHKTAVGSPPYNIGKVYLDYIDKKPLREYIEKQVKIFEAETHTILDDGVIIRVMCDCDVFPSLHFKVAEAISDSTGWVYRVYTWLKPKAYDNLTEHVFVFARTAQYLKPRNDTVEWYRDVGIKPITKSVIETRRNRDAYRIDHKYKNDATFPEELVEVILASYCEPGDWVLDSFCGTGTVGITARRYGIHATLIDQSRVACDSICRTLKQKHQTIAMDIVGVIKQSMLLRTRLDEGGNAYTIQRHPWIGKKVAREFDDGNICAGIIVSPQEDKEEQDEEWLPESGVYHVRVDDNRGLVPCLRVLYDDDDVQDFEFEEALEGIELYKNTTTGSPFKRRRIELVSSDDSSSSSDDEEGYSTPLSDDPSSSSDEEDYSTPSSGEEEEDEGY